MSNDDQLGLLAASVVPAVGPGGSSSAGLAAAALGWGGAVLDDVRLFGQHVAVVADIDREAHEARLATGWRPVTDRMSVALWEWSGPQHPEPPAVVSLRGVIATGKRWQRVLATASGFVGFSAIAIVLEQEHEPNQHCLMTAHLHGAAVLRAAKPHHPVLVQPGRDGPIPTARPSTLSRWVEELIYQRLLDERALTMPDSP